jgi:Domain of unknown function (DUF4157)
MQILDLVYTDQIMSRMPAKSHRQREPQAQDLLDWDAPQQGQPLDPAVCAHTETKFGHNFGAVRVYSDAEAHALNQRLEAQAVTRGSSIYFRSGEYQPQTRAGLSLLAHELAHVVQHERASGGQRVDALVAPVDAASELEADRASRSVLSGAHAVINQAPSAVFSRRPAPPLSDHPEDFEGWDQPLPPMFPPPREQPSGYHNEDESLDPIRAAQNDPSLSHEQRAQLMYDYRNAQLERMSVGTDTAWAMNEMNNASPDAPIYLGGAKRGSHMPLFEKLGDDPDMQQMMSQMADSINSQKPGELDIQKIFKNVQQDSEDMDLNDPRRNRKLMALQAMATLVNASKFDPQGKGTKPPDEILEKLPEGLYDKIKAANAALATSESGQAAVMGHNQTTSNAFDNNAHFFTHAYLTGSLTSEYGLSGKDAQAMSGLIGAQYELLPTSIHEGSGNAGIKDILMNAEGASFGTDFINGKRSDLPGQMEGPQVENRDRTVFPDAKPDALPEGVKDISENSSSKWRMLWNWF